MIKSFALVSAVSLSSSSLMTLSSAFSPLMTPANTGRRSPSAHTSTSGGIRRRTNTSGTSSSSSSSPSSSSQLRYIVTSLEEQRHYQSSYLEDILDMNISEDSIRKHYHEWCAKFHRKQDSFRFIVFQRNYLSQFKWNLAAGKQAFTLNEYADCTEEEYKLLMERAAEKAKYTTTPVALEEQALEVTVVFDENDIPHVDFQTPNNYIDAEVVEKEPHWLA